MSTASSQTQDQADNTVLDITHNLNKHRFETEVDGTLAYISYQIQGERLVYDHTIVPDAIGGRGIGSALVAHALDYARSENKKVVPQCPFVASYIEKHPEYKDLTK
ncbi:GNAT family N-acetyltransferase [Psychrobacter aestuarii]|uniref:GNAT family N-acetyltransferase n=1 Tax=Psychrobacter aestuarii TaxID=556327 RepID=A0ABP3FSF1_9GAMM|nr:GNAT family N-acetyltransferase [Psychrobacter aestuarii]